MESLIECCVLSRNVCDRNRGSVVAWSSRQRESTAEQRFGQFELCAQRVE